MLRSNDLSRLFIVLFFFLPVFSFTGSLADQPWTVVIDPGHGGHDPGALGRQSKEKNINLSIALKLGNLIQRNMPGVKVIYTRDRDKFVELYKRAELANRNKADLFISIHCNASENRAMQGAETYVMGLHKSKANLAIAKLENAAILLEDDYISTYDGFDPNSDESYILFSLNQNANLERSTGLAAAIQSQMTARSGIRDRGVRQAGFLVLYKTTMPSVLVETGYISNSADEKFLISADGQDYIAQAIYKAFNSFATSTTGKTRQISKEVSTDSASGEVAADKEPETQVHSTAAPVEKPPVKEKPVNKSVVPATPAVSKSNEFRIQVATSPDELPEDAKVYRDFSKVGVYRHGGLYKYTTGNYSDLDKARQNLKEIRSRGYKDAFIVVFRNNERIPQAEADRILRQ